MAKTHSFQPGQSRLNLSDMKRLFWVDLEMTGLDESVHQIIEIAVIVTDLDLKELDTYHAVVFQPPEILKLMDEWCTQTHGASGLTKQIPDGQPLSEVDTEVEALIEKHYRKEERVILVGNSVNNDKRFIDKYMPKTAKRLHYRLVDVSSFKEIFREKYGVKFEKESNHRAVDDIKASIQELSTYLGYIKV